LAIIVDKEQKRKDIAFACKDLLLEKGIKNITISQIAKSADIGKGTVYEYFENKEDIVFEIMTAFIAEYEEKLIQIVSQNISIKEKLFHFLYKSFEDDDSLKQLALYREFLAIIMTNGTDEMIEFNIDCRKRFELLLIDILKEGVNNNEVSSKILTLESMILTFAIGLIVDVQTIKLNPKKEIEKFVDTLFDLITIKE
jgi:AcrR family transcriptional regulator